MLGNIYLIFQIAIIILVVLDGIISTKQRRNNNIILNIKEQLVIDIILSISFFINTGIKVFTGGSKIIIGFNLLVTIIWEIETDAKIKRLRILEDKLNCKDN